MRGRGRGARRGRRERPRSRPRAPGGGPARARPRPTCWPARTAIRARTTPSLSLRRADDELEAADAGALAVAGRRRWPQCPSSAGRWTPSAPSPASAVEVVAAAQRARRPAAVRPGRRRRRRPRGARRRPARPARTGARAARAVYDALRTQPLGLTPPQVSDGVDAGAGRARSGGGRAASRPTPACRSCRDCSAPTAPGRCSSCCRTTPSCAAPAATPPPSRPAGRRTGGCCSTRCRTSSRSRTRPDADRYLPAPGGVRRGLPDVRRQQHDVAHLEHVAARARLRARRRTRSPGPSSASEPDVVVLLDVPAMGAPGGARRDGDRAAGRLAASSRPSSPRRCSSTPTPTPATSSRRRSAAGCSCRLPRRPPSDALLSGDVPRRGARPRRSSGSPTSATWRSGRPRRGAGARSRSSGVAGAAGAARGRRPVARQRQQHRRQQARRLRRPGGHRRARWSGRRRPTVTQRVRFTNRAPPDLVPYVAGVERPGVVVSRVELSLPPAADDLVATIDGKPWTGALHAGGGRSRLIARLELPAGRVVGPGGPLHAAARPTVATTCGSSRSRSSRTPPRADRHGRRRPPLGDVSGAELSGGRLEEAGALVRDARRGRAAARGSAVPLGPPQGLVELAGRARLTRAASRRRAVRGRRTSCATGCAGRARATSSRRSAGRAAPTRPRTGPTGR